MFSPRDTSVMKLKFERSCNKCKGVKPPRAHHCSVCERCVLKMDHHCPWMNNCIGLNNQKAFVLFNLYTTVCALWAFVRIVIGWVRCK